jgi:hypothetical protein
MPMGIRRKGRPIEKLENPTALQRRGRSFSYDAANQITLVSTCGWIASRYRAQGKRSRFGALKLPHRHGRACPGHTARRTWMPGTSPGMTTFCGCRACKIAPRTSLAGYEGFPGQSCGILREIAPGNAQMRKLFGDRAEVSCDAAALVLGWRIPTIRVVTTHRFTMPGFTTLVRR